MKILLKKTLDFFFKAQTSNQMPLLLSKFMIMIINFLQKCFSFLTILNQYQRYMSIFKNILIFIKMNSEIIIRVRSPQGQHRITVRAGDTYGQLLLQISRKLNYKINDLIVNTDDNKLLKIPDGKKLYQIPYFRDGSILIVSSKHPNVKKQHTGVLVEEVKNDFVSSKCNHPPGGKCLNCIGDSKVEKKGSQKPEQQKKPVGKCNHGPGGKCLNCTVVDENDKNTKQKWLCKHGPNAKCPNCLDMQFISDAAHISFDAFLQQKKLKCKGVHPADVKCNNCLPPSQIRYQVDRTCKNHQPYPKAMCNKCIPPSVVIKRQQYRHVDYVEFMNINEISNFVKFWVQKKHMAQQRVGFLYGYYAEDPHYKGGIRAIVEAIYEPEQRGTYNSFQILNDKFATTAEMVAGGLTLEKIGWIFTENNNDTFMSESQVKMAAKYQQQFKVYHSSGYEISNFITVILRNDPKHQGQVKPEVYMISDQGQALQKYQLFQDSGNRKLMKVKVPQSNKQALPSFIVSGKSAIQFETEFLLVKIAHGSSKSNKFAILKNSEFPVFNRTKATIKDLKEYLKKYKHKPSYIKYGDFNLLMYLAEALDIETVLSISEQVAKEGKVSETIDELIQHKADL